MIDVSGFIRHHTWVGLALFCTGVLVALLLGLTYFFKSLFNFIKKIRCQSRLLLWVSHSCNINLIFSIKSLNLLKNTKWIVLNRLLQSSLQYFSIYDFNHKVEVFNHLLMLIRDQLLLIMVLLHSFIMLFLGFVFFLPLSFLLLFFELVLSHWCFGNVSWLFGLFLVEWPWPLIFKLILIDILNSHLSIIIIAKVPQNRIK